MSGSSGLDGSEDVFYTAPPPAPHHRSSSGEEDTNTSGSVPLEELFPEHPPHNDGPTPVFDPPLPPGNWLESGSESEDGVGDGSQDNAEVHEEGHEEEHEEGDAEENNAEVGAEDGAEDDSQASEVSTTEPSDEDEEGQDPGGVERFVPKDWFPTIRKGSPVEDEDDARHWRGEGDRDFLAEEAALEAEREARRREAEGDENSGQGKTTNEANRQDGTHDGEGQDEAGEEDQRDSSEGESSYGPAEGVRDYGGTQPGNLGGQNQKGKKKDKEAMYQPLDLDDDHEFPPVGYAWGGEPTAVKGGDQFPGFEAEEPRESEAGASTRSAWSRNFIPPEDVSDVTESTQRADGLPKRSHYIVDFPIGRVGSWEDGTDGYGYIPPPRVAGYEWKRNRKFITLIPSDGMLEEIEGAEEAMEKIRRVGADWFLERVLTYYDHAMLLQLMIGDSALLAYKQIRHDRRFIRGMNDFFQKMERSMDNTTTDLRLTLARALLDNAKLRDQIEMMKQGIDLDEDEFLRPDYEEEKADIEMRVKSNFPREEEESEDEKEKGEAEKEKEKKIKKERTKARRRKRRERKERRERREGEREEKEAESVREGDREDDRHGHQGSDRTSEYTDYNYEGSVPSVRSSERYLGRRSDQGSEFSDWTEEVSNRSGDEDGDDDGDEDIDEDSESECEPESEALTPSPSGNVDSGWEAEQRERLEWHVDTLNDEVERYRAAEEKLSRQIWILEASIDQLTTELNMVRTGNPEGKAPAAGQTPGQTEAELKMRAVAAETLLEYANIEKRKLKKELEDEEAHARLLEEIAAKYEKEIRDKTRDIKRLEAITKIPIADKYDEFLKSVQEAAGQARALDKDEDGKTAVEKAITELENRLNMVEAVLPSGITSVRQRVYVQEARNRLRAIKEEVLDLLAEVAKTKIVDSMALGEAVKTMELNRGLLEQKLDLIHKNSDLKQDIHEQERRILELSKFQREAAPWKDRIKELEKLDAEKDAALQRYQEFTRKLPMGAVIAFTDEQLQGLLGFLPKVSAYYNEKGNLDEAIQQAKLFVPSDNGDFNEMLWNLVKAFSEQAVRQELCDGDWQRARDRLALVEERERQLQAEKAWLVRDSAQISTEKVELEEATKARQAELEAARQEMTRQQDEASRKLLQAAKELSEKMEAVGRYKEEVDRVLREKKDNYRELAAGLNAKVEEANADVEGMKRILADQTQHNEETAKLLDENRERLARERELEQQAILQRASKQRELDDKKKDLLTRERELQGEISGLRADRLATRARVTRLRMDRAAMTAMLADELEHKRRRAGQAAAKEVEELRQRLEEASRPSQVCFCALLSFFLPEVYRTVACDQHHPKTPSQRPPTLTEKLASAPQPTPTPTLSHGHGHDALVDIWPYLCQLLTSTVWIVLLLLLHARNLHDYFWYTALVIVGLPLYLFRLLSYSLQKSYRHIRKSLPQSLRQVLPLPAPWREPPVFWLLKTPSASAIVGMVLMSLFAVSLLAAQAVRVERRIWLGRNNWRGAYLKDIEATVPYPAWWPVEVDFRLAVEPLLGPLVELVYVWMFEVQKGGSWAGTLGGRALEGLETDTTHGYMYFKRRW
ncbi:hypothetical protein B0T14DRAFT_491466 [Immersiella caudata]|uniref:HTH La-type RNA-binding domain-containing protein n=1 Tax=Immersiella caudata TaxID=314043 RepID=A0AA40CDB6_9PEZI|nr:hypothetical protein B0T14DRAFT_491466 [Immersiella caudata]